ncbi:MAG: nucleotidyltransferase substrate binding protein [Roseivirga sp.]|uniref:nucleotidyltransferase substrate binding protein n=1 Tax=Roseivirga sp. TaxID=1964215 RepID=UPI001B075BA9|nr:nucleotidyltransferase substrate binding protein [Roseivirga sp.]MBO6659579.1 nucleotidyltransferase substrate binding protein [Roseivirga sp.]MBO6907684.1 nucleotidyltransferase substrate binding protein [Roseivirga sp.]
MEKDIRWHQRMSNYSKALSQLEKAVALSNERELSDLEEQGLIQAFEYTHELAWNVMKDYFTYQGNVDIRGSRDAIREAFNKNLIANGEDWMETIKSRVSTVHTYNEDTAEEIATKITSKYFQLFTDFKKKMESIRSGEQGQISFDQ